MANIADKPNHKPSAKVTLGEVLTSLKDLVRNEFYEPSDDGSVGSISDKGAKVAKQDAGSATGQPRKRGRPRKYPAPHGPDYSYSQEQGDLFGPLSTEERPTRATTAEISEAEKQRTKAVTKRPPIKLETGQIRTNLKVVGSSKPADKGQISPNDRNSVTTDMAKNSNHAAQAPEDPVSLNWADDIPVLTDIVDDMLFAAEAQATEPMPKMATPEARAIAVKVAARLNIEMRETGGEPLDIKTIMRLQSLLKEALEPKG